MLGEFVPRSVAAKLAQRGRGLSEHLIDFSPDAVKDSYNRKPFLVSHHLDQHPAFKLPSLFELCRRLPPSEVKYRVGVIPETADFDSSYARFSKGLSLDDVLDRFEQSRAYICIYNPERDPTYRPILESILSEVAAAIDECDPVITWYSTYIFISTQDSVTPYHMDREMNFLLQVRGTKQVSLWDPADDEIMSPAEKDRLLSMFSSQRATYSPSFESKAMNFELRPGIGVHHPFIAPHRVTTGSELSISLAFTFRTQKSDKLTSAHAFNYLLRRCGWLPAEVGHSAVADEIKVVASNAAKVPINLLQKAWRARRMAT